LIPRCAMKVAAETPKIKHSGLKGIIMPELIATVYDYLGLQLESRAVKWQE
jgi:hypothetical protein